MAKFLIVEGMVIGGHLLTDLGTTVPFGEKVPLNHDRASWSRDLNHALKYGLVRKIKVVNGQAPRLLRGGPTTTTRKAPTPQPKASPVKPIPKPVPPKPSPASAENTGKLQESLAENARLREMNRTLLESSEAQRESQDRMLAQQQLLLDKLTEFIERPVSAGVPYPASGQVSDTLVPDDAVLYIPGQIRSDNVKSSSALEVSSAKSDGSKASKAAEMLRKLREANEESDE